MALGKKYKNAVKKFDAKDTCTDHDWEVPVNLNKEVFERYKKYKKQISYTYQETSS